MLFPSSAAQALRKKWKALVQQEQGQGQAQEQGQGKEEGEGQEEMEMRPLAIGRRAAAATTWREVYEVRFGLVWLGVVWRAVTQEKKRKAHAPCNERPTDPFPSHHRTNGQFSLLYDLHRRAVVGKRALALARGEEAQRKRTREVAAWTGEDEERERRRAEKRPAAGNTERIRKMLKVRAPVKAQERAFGGLVMLPSAVGRERKRLKVVG